MTALHSLPAPKPDRGEVVTKAVLRAAKELDINAKDLASIIGVSNSTVTRMRKQDYVLDTDSKEYELAVLFIRVFRSLDAITAGDKTIAQEWLRNKNTALAAVPSQLLKRVEGLGNVLHYLDCRRAPI